MCHFVNSDKTSKVFALIVHQRRHIQTMKVMLISSFSV